MMGSLLLTIALFISTPHSPDAVLIRPAPWPAEVLAYQPKLGLVVAVVDERGIVTGYKTRRVWQAY